MNNTWHNAKRSLGIAALSSLLIGGSVALADEDADLKAEAEAAMAVAQSDLTTWLAAANVPAEPPEDPTRSDSLKIECQAEAEKAAGRMENYYEGEYYENALSYAQELQAILSSDNCAI